MVLKEPNCLERSQLINGLERSKLVNGLENGLERTVLLLSILLAFRQYERPKYITVVNHTLQL